MMFAGEDRERSNDMNLAFELAQLVKNSPDQEDAVKQIKYYLEHYSYNSRHWEADVEKKSPLIVAFLKGIRERGIEIEDKTKQSNILNVALAIISARDSISNEERQQAPKALSLEKLFVPNKNVSPAVTNLDSLSMSWQLFMRFYLMALGLEGEENGLDRIDFNGKSLMFVGAETPKIPLQVARQFPLSRIIIVNPKWETKKGGNVIVIGDEVQQCAKYKDEIGMVDFVFSSGLFNEEWLGFIVDTQHDSKTVYERMLSPLAEILSPGGTMIISGGPKASLRKSRLEEAIQAAGLKIVNEEVDIGTEAGIYIIRRTNLRNEILEQYGFIKAAQSGL